MKHALEKAEELCSQVNEGVREKENSDRLEWIQAHVQCEGLSEVGIYRAGWGGAGGRDLDHSQLSKGRKHRREEKMDHFLFYITAASLLSNATNEYF